MNLINFSSFKSHSGLTLSWKIDCDALSDFDIKGIAKIVNSELNFSQVYGIPRGGVRLQKALEKYIISNKNFPILIVDDVLTTGNSMQEAKNKFNHPNIIGFVIFSRGICPTWIWSLFTTNTSL